MPSPFEQLELLRNAKPNWDGYGADAPQNVCIDAAAEFLRRNPDVRRLPAPYVMPTRTGGVLFAWHEGPYQLEIEVESSKRAGFVYLNVETNDSSEGEFELSRAMTKSPTPLNAILAEFGARVPA